MPPVDAVTTMAIFEFGGFTSDSEDASSFSTLPTSQFALKPSSSDIECDNASSQDEQLDPSGQQLTLLDRNSGHQTGLHDLRTVLSSKSAPLVDKTRNDVMPVQGNSNLASSNSLTLKPPPVEHVRQQPPPLQNSLATSTPLQNSPRPPCTKTPVLVPSSTTVTLSSLAKRPPLPSPLESGKAVTVDTQPKSTLKNGGLALKNSMLPSHTVAKLGDTHHKQVVSETSTSLVQSPQQPGPVGTASSESAASGGEGSVSTVISDTTKPVQNGPTTNSQLILPPPSAPETAPPSPPPPAQVSWLMDGPSSTILLLNSHVKNPPSSRLEKKDATCSPVANAASVITSQFLQHSGGGREESGAVRGSEHLPASLQVARAVPMGLNRDLHLPVVPGPVPMTSSRLPSSLPPTPITPKIEGHPIFDKRTASAQNLVARRASATTNGSNYPEMFHTARRYSDTTDRGLKQALAG